MSLLMEMKICHMMTVAKFYFLWAFLPLSFLFCLSSPWIELFFLVAFASLLTETCRKKTDYYNWSLVVSVLFIIVQDFSEHAEEVNANYVMRFINAMLTICNLQKAHAEFCKKIQSSAWLPSWNTHLDNAIPLSSIFPCKTACCLCKL